MREMLGKSGASMVVVSLYLPTKPDTSTKGPGGGAWDWQAQEMANLKARLQTEREGAVLEEHDRRVLEHLEQLDTLEVGGSGGIATPVSLALLDLTAKLDKLKAENGMVVGDWNVRHTIQKASPARALLAGGIQQWSGGLHRAGGWWSH